MRRMMYPCLKGKVIVDDQVMVMTAYISSDFNMLGTCRMPIQIGSVIQFLQMKNYAGIFLSPMFLLLNYNFMSH